MQENQSAKISYWHRRNGRVEQEKVYGDAMVRWMYQTSLGQMIGSMVVTKPTFSKIYGATQSMSWSHRKVRPFIEQFSIPINEYEAGSRKALDIKDSYATFNEFFIRKFRIGQRSFVATPERMPAPSEARYVGFETVNDEQVFPVKGKYLTAKGLLGNHEISKVFEGGPLYIARLCPVDYHRYHYPDSGKVLDHWTIHGRFESVNPLALQLKPDVFIANERQVSILQTEHFGRLAYIEVGAICVGKIVQSHRWNKPFLRGEEKGYFLFGGSTVIVMGEKGAWRPSGDIIKNTQNGMETYVQLGDEIAVKS